MKRAKHADDPTWRDRVSNAVFSPMGAAVALVVFLAVMFGVLVVARDVFADRCHEHGGRLITTMRGDVVCMEGP